MNEPDEPLSDDTLQELLKPFRDATVPAAAQIANRLAVQQALSKQARPAWWRRSIAVPIPLAIAATIALVVTIAALLQPSSARQTAVNGRPGPMSEPIAAATSKSHSNSDNSPRPAWHITQTYIHSLPALIGPIRVVEANAKENRNDS
jgi:hypothetical protein